MMLQPNTLTVNQKQKEPSQNQSISLPLVVFELT
jgi:hypothetical protein